MHAGGEEPPLPHELVLIHQGDKGGMQHGVCSQDPKVLGHGGRPVERNVTGDLDARKRRDPTVRHRIHRLIDDIGHIKPKGRVACFLTDRPREREDFTTLQKELSSVLIARYLTINARGREGVGDWRRQSISNGDGGIGSHSAHIEVKGYKLTFGKLVRRTSRVAGGRGAFFPPIPKAPTRSAEASAK